MYLGMFAALERYHECICESCILQDYHVKIICKIINCQITGRIICIISQYGCLFPVLMMICINYW